MDDTLSFLAELEHSELDAVRPNELVVPSGERPCPICGDHMIVEQMSGVNIDVCAQHGVWLDRGELPRILNQSATTNSQMRRRHAEAIRTAKQDGKIGGMIFGAWSLLSD